MKLIRDITSFPDAFRGGALSIGNFDGVHLGHARLIGRLAAAAHRLAGPAVVFTFEPSPACLLRPEAASMPLSCTERKAELLGDLGVDALVAYPTDRAFLQLDARQFFDQIVRDRLGARAVVEGPDFVFGRDRTGTVDLLRQFCAEAGMALELVEPLQIDGRIVSSSRIRQLIAAGQVAEARGLLTRPYRIHGTVGRGAGRGARLGFPTANLQQVDTLLPGEGIYAGRAAIEGRAYPAAVSIGPNPTFDEAALKIEVYLVGFQGTLNGRPIEVDFLDRLRDIKRFDSADALVAQLDRDVAAVRQIVERHEAPYG